MALVTPNGLLVDFSVTITQMPPVHGFLWHPSSIGTLAPGSDITIELVNSTDIILDEFAWDDDGTPDSNRSPQLHRSSSGGDFDDAETELQPFSFYIWAGKILFLSDEFADANRFSEWN